MPPPPEPIPLHIRIFGSLGRLLLDLVQRIHPFLPLSRECILDTFFALLCWNSFYRPSPLLWYVVLTAFRRKIAKWWERKQVARNQRKETLGIAPGDIQRHVRSQPLEPTNAAAMRTVNRELLQVSAPDVMSKDKAPASGIHDNVPYGLAHPTSTDRMDTTQNKCPCLIPIIPPNNAAQGLVPASFNTGRLIIDVNGKRSREANLSEMPSSFSTFKPEDAHTPRATYVHKRADLVADRHFSPLLFDFVGADAGPAKPSVNPEKGDSVHVATHATPSRSEAVKATELVPTPPGIHTGISKSLVRFTPRGAMRKRSHAQDRETMQHGGGVGGSQKIQPEFLKSSLRNDLMFRPVPFSIFSRVDAILTKARRNLFLGVHIAGMKRKWSEVAAEDVHVIEGSGPPSSKFILKRQKTERHEIL